MKSILITGGSGFFGRNLARRLLVLGAPPERIIIFSRGEHTQADTAERLKPIDPDHRLRFFIGDVRDRKRLERALRDVEVVVHAAALKRIEVGAYNPEEMVLTNVIGTMNVVQACRDQGIERAVLTSTDKAYRPTSSAYGLTKALAERIFLSANETSGASGPKFAVCRYGNVAGSTGSVVPRWRAAQITGSPAFCTDINCTRFWMRVSQAVTLVLDTLHSMKGGETVVPDLPAFCLSDLAVAMRLQLHMTGLPTWEKLHEQMDDDHSSDKARLMTVHELRLELEKVYADISA